MKKPAVLQDSKASASDPATLCSFDYEAIQAPTPALIHQAARFLYIKEGRGTIAIDDVEYKIVPNTLIAITPWKISEITSVTETLRLIRIVYDFQYINSVLKGNYAMAEDSSELIQFLSMEPVVYLDSVQTEYIDRIAEQLKAELGVESTRSTIPSHPLSQLYITDKLIELMIVYRRYVTAIRGEQDSEQDLFAGESILSYLYAHSNEKLTLSSVAGAFFMSESNLSKRIAALTNSSFSKLLTNIRIEKTADYLIYTDLTLNEIAELVGFVDASHLSKHFVAHGNVSPSKYRKLYGKFKTKFDLTGKNVAFAATDYIYHNYATEKLTADQIASRFGISVHELNRQMLFYTGQNCEALLNAVRINHACELLISTDYYVIDVAFEVGYNNVKTFNMNFMKYKGMTPTEFRNRITLQKKDGSVVQRRPAKKTT